MSPQKNSQPDTLEAQRLILERERIKIEWFKAWWTGFSILIPLLIAAGTIYFNGKNQQEQAQNDFKLKAAEIVLSETSPSAAKAKAEAMTDLFPNDLPADFAAGFNAKNYSAPKVSESQKFLLTLIVEHPEQKNEIIAMWLAIAPPNDREWATKLKTVK